MQVKDMVRENDGEKEELVLTITASAEEVDESAKKFFAEIAQRDIPGFRKGKAPRAVLEQNVGGHKNAMGGVAEMLINELGFKAIDDADVIFLSNPDFNVENDVVEGKPFSFSVSGPVVPAMKLSSCDPVSIEMPPDEATDEEVEAELAALQDYYHSFESIDDAGHKAEMGDTVCATVTVLDDGQPVNGLRGASRMYELGDGTMPESFDEQVVGAKANEEIEFDFSAKKDDGTPEIGSGNLHAIVTVTEFRRKVVPALDDELALKVGCADVDDMRAQMRRNINEHKNNTLPNLMVERAVDVLVDRLVGEVPQYYVDFIRQDVGREVMQSFEKQGTSLQQWLLQNGTNGDDLKAEVSKEAVRRAKIDCALEAFIAEKGIDCTEDDIEKELANEDDPAAIREKWESSNRMAELRKICRHSKATRWLVQTAEVTVVDDSAEN